MREEYQERASNEQLRGVSVPTRALTRALDQLRVGEVTVLGGYEGHGKSALAQQIALHCAQQFSQDAAERKRLVFYGSMEMGVDQLLARANTQRIGRSANDLTDPKKFDPKMDAELEEFQASYGAFPMVLCDSASLTTTEIKTYLRELRVEYDPKLVVVDYLQLLADPIPAGGSKVDKMDNIIRELKDIARQFKVHLLALSSLNRSGDSFVPTTANIRDSQGIAFGADTVMFLHQPAMFDGTLDPHWANHALVIVQKQRSGPTGRYYLEWDKRYLSFKDADEDVVKRHLVNLPTKKAFSNF